MQTFSNSSLYFLCKCLPRLSPSNAFPSKTPSFYKLKDIWKTKKKNNKYLLRYLLKEISLLSLSIIFLLSTISLAIFK